MNKAAAKKNRQAALASGERYYIGNACSKCHSSKYYASSKGCVKCLRMPNNETLEQTIARHSMNVMNQKWG